jgi:hypothetical protein
MQKVLINPAVLAAVDCTKLLSIINDAPLATAVIGANAFLRISPLKIEAITALE